MNSRKWLRSVFGAFFLLAAMPAATLGQNDPAAYRLLSDKGENSPPMTSETTFAETLAAPLPSSTGCVAMGGCPTSSGPRWTASADVIILNRSGGGNQTLVERVPGFPPNQRIPGSASFGNLFSTSGSPALNGNDFEQGLRSGPRVGLIRHGDCGYDLELTYFQIDGWSSNRTVVPNDSEECLVMRAPGHWVDPTTSVDGWNGWIQTNQDATQAMAWTYASELHNAEFNARWNPSDRITLLAGFRWVNLRENLVGALSPPTISTEPPFWTTTTKNNLYGLQIGAEGKLFERGRFSINALFKAGIFDNNAEQTTAVSVIHKSVFSATDSINRTAFVGETGLMCKYQVTQRLMLKAGYEAIWIEGVALAPEQIQETYTTTRWSDSTVQATGINCDSGMFFHGITAGLECSF